MVDSSVGGKTGVNHELGKNLIGTFWQPSEVWIDIKALDTLSEREYRSGMAEVAKYAFIGGQPFFDWVESNINALLSREPETLIEAIERSCRFKAHVVEQDERESGLRAILNYGHTFGHAIEAVGGYGTLLHGEAVNYGMRAAAELGLGLGKVDKDFVEKHNRICKLLAPAALPKLKPDSLMDAMLHDKKVQNSKMRLVIPNGYGSVELTDSIKPEIIRDAWKKIL
jgi:3-dehydroquinate synthase